MAALYHWGKRRGTGETLLFAFELVNSNNSLWEHCAQVSSTDALRCPHIFSAQFLPSGISLPLPFRGPSSRRWLQPLFQAVLGSGMGALAKCCSRPAAPCPCPRQALVLGQQFLTCEAHACLGARRVGKPLSAPSGVKHHMSALHPHPDLLTERTSPPELLKWLLAPF